MNKDVKLLTEIYDNMKDSRMNRIKTFVALAQERIGKRWHTVTATMKEESGALEDYVVLSGTPSDILVLFKDKEVEAYPNYEHSKEHISSNGNSKEDYVKLLDTILEIGDEDFKDEDDLNSEDDKSVYECDGEKVIRIGNICTGGYTQYWLPYEPLKTMNSIVSAIKSGKITLYYTGDDPYGPSDGMLITGMWQEYAERLGAAPNYWTSVGSPDLVKTKETHNLVLPNKLFQVTWRDVQYE